MATDTLSTNLIAPVEVPTHWYNLAAELATPPPPHLHPGTKEPVQPSDLAALFPAALIAQEGSTEAYIEIPEPIREIYRTWRPSPLIRATRFEQALNTRARIYCKYEGVSPVGSHKTNSAVAQAYFNHVDGVTKLTTETGAGQWGSALAFACAMFGIELEIWQVRASYDSKPYRRYLMNVYGAQCTPALPTSPNRAGRCSPNIPTPAAVSASRSAKRSRSRPRIRRPAMHWAACSITSCCTRP